MATSGPRTAQPRLARPTAHGRLGCLGVLPLSGGFTRGWKNFGGSLSTNGRRRGRWCIHIRSRHAAGRRMWLRHALHRGWREQTHACHAGNFCTGGAAWYCSPWLVAGPAFLRQREPGEGTGCSCRCAGHTCWLGRHLWGGPLLGPYAAWQYRALGVGGMSLGLATFAAGPLVVAERRHRACWPEYCNPVDCRASVVHHLRLRFVGGKDRSGGGVCSIRLAVLAGRLQRTCLEFLDRKSTRLNSSHVKIS